MKSTLTVDVPDSVMGPLRSASPGLIRYLSRTSGLSAEELIAVGKLHPNAKLLAALAKQGQKGEAELLEQMSRDLGVERLELTLHDLTLWPPEAALRDLLSRRFSVQHRCFPIRRSSRGYQVALADPLDVETIREIEFLAQSSVDVLLAAEGAILRAINRCLPDPSDSIVFDEPTSASDPGIELVIDETRETHGSDYGHDAPPIVKLVNKIMADAASAGASDIHFVPTAANLDVKFRIDGVLTDYLQVQKRNQPYVTTRLKLLAGMDIAEKRRPQDGRFRMQLNERTSRDIRASVVPTPYGETIVLRVLRGDFSGVTFGTLGFPPEMQHEFEDALTATEQLILVAGPTGSGKTTSLYAAINHLHDGTRTIITVEDPIEFKIEGLTQIQVDQKIGITFATGLRSILRQDPDVILVGEIRDLETAEVAFQAAQTGHLVLSTVHTNDATSAVVRLMDIGVEPYLISTSLRGVLAQRLVRRLCVYCAEPLAAKEEEALATRLQLPGGVLRRSKGCDKCDQLGYRGRVGVYSLLTLGAEVREMIRARASIPDIHEAAKRGGLRDLQDSARDLLKAGVTSVEEVERVLGSLGTTPVEAPVFKGREPRAGSGGSLASLISENQTPRERSRVLVIDDDESVRYILSQLLQKEGYDVVEARDGGEGMRVLEQERPDLVVCDVMMPKFNGTDFLKTIRGHGQHGMIPVLMLTASDSEAAELALLEAGADDFISKTASPGVILARLKRLEKRLHAKPEAS